MAGKQAEQSLPAPPPGSVLLSEGRGPRSQAGPEGGRRTAGPKDRRASGDGVKGGAGCSLPRVPDWRAREPAACCPGVQCSGEGSGGQRPRSCLRKDRLRLQRPQPGPRRPLSVESFRARRPAAGGRRLVTLTPGAAPNWGPRVPCAPPSPGVTGWSSRLGISAEAAPGPRVRPQPCSRRPAPPPHRLPAGGCAATLGW